jgi:hypothetical protein
MEYAKSANRSRRESPIGRSPSPSKKDQKDAEQPVGKKTVRTKAAKKTVARPLQKMGSKLKSNKLVCRYCGSDDLAPSFIKRRDRRCRGCFSKRYGSAARAGKAKVKK